MANYKKRWTWDALNGRPRIVSATGTRRRIEALMWLGWSGHVIGQRLGMTGNNVTRIRQSETLTSTMAGRVARLFDELCMTLPTGNVQAITNVRNIARRRGYLPPLAWDDIDHDPEPARAERDGLKHEQVDHIVVERLLAGERIHATRAEKDEAMRRWKAMGRSERSLCEIHGWKDARYGRSVA